MHFLSSVCQRLGVMCRYDIGCRFGPRFLSWIRNGGMQVLSSTQRQRLCNMLFPLPPWHHNMHNAACQFMNSARDMPGAGRAAGEPPEQVWAYLGRFGKILQYASLSKRAATLECAISFWRPQASEYGSYHALLVCPSMCGRGGGHPGWQQLVGSGRRAWSQ